MGCVVGAPLCYSFSCKTTSSIRSALLCSQSTTLFLSFLRLVVEKMKEKSRKMVEILGKLKSFRFIFLETKRCSDSVLFEPAFPRAVSVPSLSRKKKELLKFMFLSQRFLNPSSHESIETRKFTVKKQENQRKEVETTAC